eukprot:gnl/Dysnectes_brevis/6850_a10938_393.p1 GENE.gnl/Dysnectes_brevis/6850_a10938_393~~gnl/Dysnectes_brevis/6850_a10938_393.p1  ORF type:complete len:127 (-),score=2.49 gnl/Dysnectes_brevis/6850_a10938_393:53-433(-)
MSNDLLESHLRDTQAIITSITDAALDEFNSQTTPYCESLKPSKKATRKLKTIKRHTNPHPSRVSKTPNQSYPQDSLDSSLLTQLDAFTQNLLELRGGVVSDSAADGFGLRLVSWPVISDLAQEGEL